MKHAVILRRMRMYKFCHYLFYQTNTCDGRFTIRQKFMAKPAGSKVIKCNVFKLYFGE